MNIWGISDLHLSTLQPKPMDIFGEEWQGHEERVFNNWRNQVSHEDLVLLPGDLSWAMKLEDAQADLDKLAELPGLKILGKGNHCYWWGTNKKVRDRVHPSIVVLDNETALFPFRGGQISVTGVRGWICPSDIKFEESDQKIWNKEFNRLQTLLRKPLEGDLRILAIHFPPFDNQGKPSAMIPLIQEAGIQIVVYGHLHGSGREGAIDGEKWGIDFHCISADHIGFSPKIVV